MNDATSLYNSYENYSETSAIYDPFRTPIGVEVIADRGPSIPTMALAS